MYTGKTLRYIGVVILSAYVFVHLWNDLLSKNIFDAVVETTSNCTYGNQEFKTLLPDPHESKLDEILAQATWSDKWPHVNLRDCGQIEFMDRGINSPDPKSQHFYPRTGIVSAPGHGNTWTRHLIEQATGLWTGSVFDDEALKNGGFQGEFENCKLNSTVAIKAHWIDRSACTFERVVLVVRNLRLGCLAEFNRQRGKGHLGLADIKTFRSRKWKEFVKETSSTVSADIMRWITKYIQGAKELSGNVNPFVSNPNLWNNLLLVSYERLRRQPVEEVERIVKFLGLPVFRRHCVEADTFGHFKRQSSGIPIQCFYKDPETKQFMEKAVLSLSQMAEQRGAGNITSEFEIIDFAASKDCPF